MQKRIAALMLAGAIGFALGGAALAQSDPTVHQIYEAAAGGHLDQAQQMIEQVLRDHPDSSKAHYVQSELFAREGKLGAARLELERAEQLDPGLPKENPRSVTELKEQLGRTGAGLTGGLTAGGFRPAVASTASVTHFPWGMVLILALAVGVLWMLFRRRAAPARYPLGAAPAAAGYGPGYGPGPYPGAGGYGPGVGAGGLGSTLAGGLAGGLAAGAGIVAGEELAHHFLDGEHTSASAGSVAPAALPDDSDSIGANSDMGGTDFGVQDAGSWSDDSGGDIGGGGGDDWT